MEEPELGYPTRRQIEDCFNAWKEGGQAGILAFLKNQRAEREEGENVSDDSGQQTERRQSDSKAAESE
jgi:hypothetical protein